MAGSRLLDDRGEIEGKALGLRWKIIRKEDEVTSVWSQFQVSVIHLPCTDPAWTCRARINFYKWASAIKDLVPAVPISFDYTSRSKLRAMVHSKRVEESKPQVMAFYITSFNSW